MKSAVVFATVLGALASMTACSAAAGSDDAQGSQAAVTSTASTSDPGATAGTKTVFANLRSFDFGSSNAFDHRVLVGQEEPDVSNRSTNGLDPITSDMSKLAGKEPAVVGYELSEAYEDATTMFDPAAFRAGRPALQRLVLDKRRKGALVSLAWHMRCPKTSIRQPDSYAPSDCPPDYRLEELLQRKSNGAAGAHFGEWRAMLDELAELLWSLKDDRGELVPVQIRPFHEFTGSWFWWGEQNDAATYAAVWREMVTYLRDGRGLHNVLWVFCPAAPTDYGDFQAFYPGDAYVDVIAFDRYDTGDGSFARGFAADLGEVGAFARARGKAAAVAEVGTDLGRRGLSADPTWFTRAMLASLETPGRSFAYVSVWRNAPWEKFLPEPGDGAIADDFRRLTSSPATLFAGEHDLYLPLHAPSGP